MVLMVLLTRKGGTLVEQDIILRTSTLAPNKYRHQVLLPQISLFVKSLLHLCLKTGKTASYFQYHTQCLTNAQNHQCTKSFIKEKLFFCQYSLVDTDVTCMSGGATIDLPTYSRIYIRIYILMKESIRS